MARKVLFLDSVHPTLEEKLTQLGYLCDQDYTSSKQNIEEIVANYFGVVVRSRFTIDKTFLDKAKNSLPFKSKTMTRLKTSWVTAVRWTTYVPCVARPPAATYPF